jgi:hypothetical protein
MTEEQKTLLEIIQQYLTNNPQIPFLRALYNLGLFGDSLHDTDNELIARIYEKGVFNKDAEKSDAEKSA